MPVNEDSQEHVVTCQDFIERTKELRRQLQLKKTEYQEAAMDPCASQAMLRRLELAISELESGIKRSWPK